MNKCVKLIFFLLLVVLLFSCSKENVTACFTFKDCLGNNLTTDCEITENQAREYAAAHSAPYCKMTYVRGQ